jgi:hypothetical protein
MLGIMRKKRNGNSTTFCETKTEKTQPFEVSLNIFSRKKENERINRENKVLLKSLQKAKPTYPT